MSDSHLETLRRAYSASGAQEDKIRLLKEEQRHKPRPYGEAAGHGWCRACKGTPSLLIEDDLVFIVCEGLYRYAPPGWVVSVHGAAERYKMRDDEDWCCKGSPCLCEEICPGWEWFVE